MSRGGKKKEQTLTQVMARLLEKELVPDLVERARMPGVEAALRARWEREQAARRTADAFEIWVKHAVEQVGAAWILSVAFVRTLEDRGLLERRRIAGHEAYDSEHGFFRLFPALGPRDYLLTVFRELSRLPGAEDLLGPGHNPAWRLAPSNAAAQKLLDAWRKDDEARTPLWTFEGTDTRFLGDLYQDLSEDARERFALLQTPDFVERFILKLTLDPAVAEFGLDAVRLIDPTCGSGHFLLGAYDRLFDLRLGRAPGVDRRAHALAALGQVHGVDLNPYAVAIARFRLTLSFLEKAGIAKLAAAPKLPLNLAVADSLLVAARGTTRQLAEEATDRTGWGFDLFDFEDEAEARRILGQGYHAVVGNPPYITCKDAVLRREYASIYQSCSMNYALSVPFTERFFQLAAPGGVVGLINANSFTKREFGKQLIENVLPAWLLDVVIDTSGAYIPGHGTPTIILVGRSGASEPGRSVRAVLGKRGEPSTPEDPANGLVWSSIEAHWNSPGFENDFVSVADLPVSRFGTHPWSLGGGGASELKAELERRANQRLRQLTDDLGFSVIIGEDEIFTRPNSAYQWSVLPKRPLVIGEGIRDWTLSFEEDVIFPLAGQEYECVETPEVTRELWAFRRVLEERVVSGSTTMKESNRRWFDLRRFSRDKNRRPLSLAFAFVATHNHFVLDRGGKVFNRSAPIIKLPDAATEDDHLALLAYLNSSTACFWMKQAMMNKAGSGIGRGVQDEAWENRFEFDGTKLNDIPVPPAHFGSIGVTMTLLAERREHAMPAAVLQRWRPELRSCAEEVTSGGVSAEAALARMCALQEELDWLVYDAFGLLTPEDRVLLEGARAEVWPEIAASDETDIAVCGLRPGHRAFEIVLARDCAASGTHTAWFERNGYGSPEEIAGTYSEPCQRLLQARVAIIDRNSQIRLIEKPEFKRRWTLRAYDEEACAVAEGLILDALERAVRTSATSSSLRRCIEDVLAERKTREIATWRFGADPADAITDLVAGRSIPHVASLRFTDAGMEKRALWERTWDLQRREDAGEKLDEPIPVPPKYDQKDYRDPVFWRLRGKLDVPKERFISYPGAERDDDKSPIIGWAGWDHFQRAQALAALYQERKEEAWTKERLAPLLAGLLELVPWLKQWHNEPSASFGGQRLGDYFAQYVESEARENGLTLDDLRAWRPAAKGKEKKK